MVQEEFAHRLNQTTYSDHCSLGMVARLDWKIELAQKVPPHFFSPQPKVQSHCTVESNSKTRALETDSRVNPAHICSEEEKNSKHSPKIRGKISQFGSMETRME